MSQFLRRLPCQLAQEHARETLDRCAAQRSAVISELGMSSSAGRKLLLRIAHEGSIPQALLQQPFLLALQRASIYLKRIAVNCLPEVHEVCVGESEKPILAYLCQAVEDSVMQAWQAGLARLSDVEHFSLHVDGFDFHEIRFLCPLKRSLMLAPAESLLPEVSICVFSSKSMASSETLCRGTQTLEARLMSALFDFVMATAFRTVFRLCLKMAELSAAISARLLPPARELPSMGCDRTVICIRCSVATR